MLFRVFKLHLKYIKDVVCHFDQEMQDLFFARAEQGAIPLIECQIVAFENLHVFLERVGVPA